MSALSPPPAARNLLSPVQSPSSYQSPRSGTVLPAPRSFTPAAAPAEPEQAEVTVTAQTFEALQNTAKMVTVQHSRDERIPDLWELLANTSPNGDYISQVLFYLFHASPDFFSACLIQG